jgi:hypothetical protein
VRAIPATEEEKRAAKQLRADVGRVAAAGGRSSTAEWNDNQMRLGDAVARFDARAFLAWDVVAETMFLPPYAELTLPELKFLKRQGWGRWRNAIRETSVGMPFPSLFHWTSSANAIHHGYHLARFEEETGIRVPLFDEVLEFGGGYGSLCRIVHALGLSGRYTIVDLPAQAALQRYYLDLVGLRGVRTLRGAEEIPTFLNGRRLLIGTWSLSESPLEVRERVTQAITCFDGFLIAYQDEFAGVDNVAYFREWCARFPGVVWKEMVIEHLPADRYLFGVKNIAHGGH